jgi:hypothetical protein
MNDMHKVWIFCDLGPENIKMAETVIMALFIFLSTVSLTAIKLPTKVNVMKHIIRIFLVLLVVKNVSPSPLTSIHSVHEFQCKRTFRFKLIQLNVRERKSSFETLSKYIEEYLVIMIDVICITKTTSCHKCPELRVCSYILNFILKIR